MLKETYKLLSKELILYLETIDQMLVETIESMLIDINISSNYDDIKKDLIVIKTQLYNSQLAFGDLVRTEFMRSSFERKYFKKFMDIDKRIKDANKKIVNNSS
ncbi:hypothetical protein [Vallitalea guaymasensis]|uniref:hypothetical protein n=1 Tax=Vallitalea guaymasensis TaxID=1185412 RepID=UPI000DE4A5C7|nr:hypothetical protein [Vallitalea guaymasensis]